MDFNLPTYLFKGRTYKTVAGLSKAIFQDCGCDAHSMVVDRIITATVGRKPDERIVARYHVNEPTPGEPMRVTRETMNRSEELAAIVGEKLACEVLS